MDQEAVVRGNGLDGDDRDLVFVGGHALLQRLEVVERQDQGFTGVGLGHPCRGGRAKGGQTAARLHQQGVGMPVVAAVELDNLVSSCDAAGQPNRRHGRFRAGRHEPNAVRVPVVGQDEFAELVFEACGGPEGRAVGQRGRDAFHHRGVGVAKDQRSPRATKVDEFVAVGVPNVGTLSSVHEQGSPPHRFERSNRRVHTAGKQGLGLVKKGRRRSALEGRCHFSAKLAQHERASHP